MISRSLGVYGSGVKGGNSDERGGCRLLRPLREGILRAPEVFPIKEKPLTVQYVGATPRINTGVRACNPFSRR